VTTGARPLPCPLGHVLATGAVERCGEGRASVRHSERRFAIASSLRAVVLGFCPDPARVETNRIAAPSFPQRAGAKVCERLEALAPIPRPRSRGFDASGSAPRNLRSVPVSRTAELSGRHNRPCALNGQTVSQVSRTVGCSEHLHTDDAAHRRLLLRRSRATRRRHRPGGLHRRSGPTQLGYWCPRDPGEPRRDGAGRPPRPVPLHVTPFSSYDSQFSARECVADERARTLAQHARVGASTRELVLDLGDGDGERLAREPFRPGPLRVGDSDRERERAGKLRSPGHDAGLALQPQTSG
jgi:hypothetical protein